MTFPTFHWWLHRDNLSHQKSNKGFSLLLCRRQSTMWHVLHWAEPQTIPHTGEAARTLRRVLLLWGLSLQIQSDTCLWGLEKETDFSGLPNLPIMTMEIAGLITMVEHGCVDFPVVLPKDILSQLDPDKWLGIHRPACQETTTTSAFICKHFGVPLGSNTDTCLYLRLWLVCFSSLPSMEKPPGDKGTGKSFLRRDLSYSHTCTMRLNHGTITHTRLPV